MSYMLKKKTSGIFGEVTYFYSPKTQDYYIQGLKNKIHKCDMKNVPVEVLNYFNAISKQLEK